MPDVNIVPGQDAIDYCAANIPQGMDIATYLKLCYFIYDQDPDKCTIRIEDKSERINAYDQLTDQHVVTVYVYDSEGVLCAELNLSPFGNLTIPLPKCGEYTVEIDTQYTIFYDNQGEIIEHTFQDVLMYCIQCGVCGDYHNDLLEDIRCRIASTACEIEKRKCVGRDYYQLQENVYALSNYLYAICKFDLCADDYDAILCAVNDIKKVC